MFSEDAFEDLGQGTYRDEERLPGGQPSVLLRDSSRWDKAVDMGMIVQSPGPGVKDGEDAQCATDKARISGELQERLGCGTHEDVVDLDLMAACRVVELMRQGKDDVEVRHAEKLSLPILDPCLGVCAMAFGAGTIEAGVIGIVGPSAGLTDKDLSTEPFGTTIQDILHGHSMPWRHTIPEGIQIGLAILSEDVGHFQHDTADRSRGSLSVD